MEILKISLLILCLIFLSLAFNYEAHHKKPFTDYLYCDDDCLNCPTKIREKCSTWRYLHEKES